MVGFYYLIRLGTALYDIGIDGTLREEIYAVKLSRLFFEHSDKLCADDLSLLFGIGYACEFVEESVHAVRIYKGRAQFFSEHSYDLLGFSLSKKTVVYVNAHQLFADSFDEKRCDDRAVNAARKREEHLFVAYLLSEQFHLIVDEVLHIPVSLSLAGIEYEGFKVAFLDRGALIGSVIKRYDRHGRAVDFSRDVDLNAVYNVVGTAV